jgi:hypothetical protein
MLLWYQDVLRMNEHNRAFKFILSLKTMNIAYSKNYKKTPFLGKNYVYMN